MEIKSTRKANKKKFKLEENSQASLLFVVLLVMFPSGLGFKKKFYDTNSPPTGRKTVASPHPANSGLTENPGKVSLQFAECYTEIGCHTKSHSK